MISKLAVEKNSSRLCSFQSVKNKAEINTRIRVYTNQFVIYMENLSVLNMNKKSFINSEFVTHLN